MRLQFHHCDPQGNCHPAGFDHTTPDIVFDNDTNMWLLAAGLYLEGKQWLEREVGREDAGYEWHPGLDGMEILRQVSENDPTLTELNLYGKHLGNAGASALAELLKVNRTLTVLFIQVNAIGDAGASALAEALKVNNTLTMLNISYNSIGVAGASALAESLKVNKTLTRGWTSRGTASAMLTGLLWWSVLALAALLMSSSGNETHHTSVMPSGTPPRGGH